MAVILGFCRRYSIMQPTKAINVTAKESAHLLLLLLDTGMPTIVASVRQRGHDISDQELETIVDKVRSVAVDFMFTAVKSSIENQLANPRKPTPCDCSKHEAIVEGDCPAGRWWHVCSNCGKIV